ncbi:Ribonuclease/ribotoxin [Triangularia verruculosa]|uniref:Ribonuclease/ribotoxin n=1 Tax=Triangularia verruculosa TaxID=2587418 RepID=A0AAN6XN55_9PEZI|nr:Ribonuclease/ribotoxin [Triangularia verruculosa]
MKVLRILLGFIVSQAVGAPLEISGLNATAVTDVNMNLSAAEFRCHNDAYPNNIITFNFARVLDNVQSFPDRETPGRSGYPHEFKNIQGIVWDFNTWRCSRSGYKPLLEMPVFPDGHLYPWDERRDSPNGQNPGPARAIYAAPGGTIEFCGLIAHVSGNQGYLEKCDVV